MPSRYALIRISTGDCIYAKRNTLLPCKKLPVPGIDKDLKWYEMEYTKYPSMDVETQGMTYKEELIGDKFKVTYFPFLLSDGIKAPVTILRGK